MISLYRSSFSRFLHLVMVSAIFLLVFSRPLSAEETPDALVRELSEDIKVDGILDESSWKEAPGIDNLTQVEPHPFESPTERTKVWLAYNKDALYIAVLCEDRNPDKIVATEMRRDARLSNNDNIDIILDTYHDRRNAYNFSTNAVGALVDGRISENQSSSKDWDGIWNVRTHISDYGWSAEFEIPFKTIGFNPNISRWGFNISRYLTRNRETSRWASPSLDVRISHVERAGTISGINEPSQGIGLDIKTYGILGFNRDIIDRTSVTEEYDTGQEFDGGVDIFYRITSNLVSITTINTDFAETETDSRQVNLTRFPLFFPEKRSFFLEDAGIFEFAKAPHSGGPPGKGSGGDITPFFSRRIGLVNGSEVPIEIGQKFTGKIGRFDIGLLGVRTGSLGASESQNGQAVESQNLSVGRVKANFLNQSYIGAIFTYGDPTGLTDNRMTGIDFKLATSNFLNRNKNISLVLYGSQTDTSNLEGSDTAYGGTLSYPNDLIEFEYKWFKIGENYNPALGFVRRPGIRASSVSAEVSPRPEFKGIRQVSFEISYDDYYNLAEGSWESKELRLNPIRLSLESGEFMAYSYSHSKEQLFDDWMINRRTGVTLEPGVYSFGEHSLFFRTFQGRPLSIEADFAFGDFYSGTRREFSGELEWRKNRHLTTSIRFDKNWIKLPEGNFNTSLAMFRLNYSFSPFTTLTNFIQYDTESRNIGLQSRLRWILKPGNEFFFVLNHNWQENVEFDRYEEQTRFRIKFNYIFRF